jgi:hypothetical protein
MTHEPSSPGTVDPDNVGQENVGLVNVDTVTQRHSRWWIAVRILSWATASVWLLTALSVLIWGQEMTDIAQWYTGQRSLSVAAVSFLALVAVMMAAVSTWVAMSVTHQGEPRRRLLALGVLLGGYLALSVQSLILNYWITAALTLTTSFLIVHLWFRSDLAHHFPVRHLLIAAVLTFPVGWVASAPLAVPGQIVRHVAQSQTDSVAAEVQAHADMVWLAAQSVAAFDGRDYVVASDVQEAMADLGSMFVYDPMTGVLVSPRGGLWYLCLSSGPQEHPCVYRV